MATFASRRCRGIFRAARAVMGFAFLFGATALNEDRDPCTSFVRGYAYSWLSRTCGSLKPVGCPCDCSSVKKSGIHTKIGKPRKGAGIT
jgi:hypothetical protein